LDRPLGHRVRKQHEELLGMVRRAAQ